MLDLDELDELDHRHLSQMPLDLNWAVRVIPTIIQASRLYSEGDTVVSASKSISSGDAGQGKLSLADFKSERMSKAAWCMSRTVDPCPHCGCSERNLTPADPSDGESPSVVDKGALLLNTSATLPTGTCLA